MLGSRNCLISRIIKERKKSVFGSFSIIIRCNFLWVRANVKKNACSDESVAAKSVRIMFENYVNADLYLCRNKLYVLLLTITQSICFLYLHISMVYCYICTRIDMLFMWAHQDHFVFTSNKSSSLSSIFEKWSHLDLQDDESLWFCSTPVATIDIYSRSSMQIMSEL